MDIKKFLVPLTMTNLCESSNFSKPNQHLSSMKLTDSKNGENIQDSGTIILQKFKKDLINILGKDFESHDNEQDSKQKTDSIATLDNDIANFVTHKIQNDQIRLHVFEAIFVPPENYKFPLKEAQTPGQKRYQFRPKWLTRWKWLAYSPSKDGAYCKCCVLFLDTFLQPVKPKKSKVEKLITKPYTNWRKVYENFYNHEKNPQHRSAEMKLFTLRPALLNDWHTREHHQNQNRPTALNAFNNNLNDTTDQKSLTHKDQKRLLSNSIHNNHLTISNITNNNNNGPTFNDPMSEERHVIHDNDIANYVIHKVAKCADGSYKMHLFDSIYTPPKEFAFPRDMSNKKRPRFQYLWLTRWLWLSYSPRENGAYCKYCVFFVTPALDFTDLEHRSLLTTTNSKKSLGNHDNPNNDSTNKTKSENKISKQKMLAAVSLIDKPYRNWNKGVEHFNNHEKSEIHRKSIYTYLALKGSLLSSINQCATDGTAFDPQTLHLLKSFNPHLLATNPHHPPPPTASRYLNESESYMSPTKTNTGKIKMEWDDKIEPSNKPLKSRKKEKGTFQLSNYLPVSNDTAINCTLNSIHDNTYCISPYFTSALSHHGAASSQRSNNNNHPLGNNLHPLPPDGSCSNHPIFINSLHGEPLILAPPANPQFLHNSQHSVPMSISTPLACNYIPRGNMSSFIMSDQSSSFILDDIRSASDIINP